MQTVKAIFDIIADAATASAVVAAGFWFFFTASFRKRIDFDVHCSRFVDPRQNDGDSLVQLMFVLQNRGQVENHCYTLAYEVESVEAGDTKSAPAFVRRSGNIVPIEAQYYYARPGVSLRVSARVWVPSKFSIIRVKACALYDNQRHDLSTDESLFKQMYKFDDWIAVDRVFSLSAADDHVDRSTK